MTTTTELNGVNVGQLVETIGAIQANPELARFQFRSSTSWEGGARSRTRVQGFYGAGQEHTRERALELVGDEPLVLLGADGGPNAVEVVLHALASCLTVGFIYNAAAEGIRVESLEFEVEGDVDLQGFLGLSAKVRPGYNDIRLRYRVRSDAPRDKLEEICDYVQRTSPVLDILRNPVPVSVDLVD